MFAFPPLLQKNKTTSVFNGGNKIKACVPFPPPPQKKKKKKIIKRKKRKNQLRFNGGPQNQKTPKRPERPPPRPPTPGRRPGRLWRQSGSSRSPEPWAPRSRRRTSRRPNNDPPRPPFRGRANALSLPPSPRFLGSGRVYPMGGVPLYTPLVLLPPRYLLSVAGDPVCWEAEFVGSSLKPLFFCLLCLMLVGLYANLCREVDFLLVPLVIPLVLLALPPRFLFA